MMACNYIFTDSIVVNMDIGQVVDFLFRLVYKLLAIIRLGVYIIKFKIRFLV